MKLWSILPQVNLRETVDVTEFAIKSDRIKDDLLEKTIESRFPAVKGMPTAHPALAAENKNGVDLKKFIAKMKLFDKAMLMYAYHHAIEESTARRIEQRRLDAMAHEKFQDNVATRKELDAQTFRIMQSWISRFRMEKLFHELRIKSLDDFKKLMHMFHVNGDIRGELQQQMFAKQKGTDPSHLPAPIQWMRITGKDEEIARMKHEIEQKNLLQLDLTRDQLRQDYGKRIIRQLEKVKGDLHHYDLQSTEEAKEVMVADERSARSLKASNES
jgi:hypothetical protein